ARGRLGGVTEFSDYRHYFLYPNLCLGLTFGTLLSLQQFGPLTPGACELRFRLFLPEATDPSREEFRLVVEDHLRDFNRRVLEEDRAPVELSQLGTAHGARRALHGVNEVRVRAFHEALVQDLAPALGQRTDPGGAEEESQS